MESTNIFWTLFLIGLTSISLVVAQQPLQIELERGTVAHRKSVGLDRNRNTLDILSQPRFRLPDELVPEEYKVEVIPIIDNIPTGTVFSNFTAPGAVKITFTSTVDTTNRITLNARDITVETYSLTDDDGTDVQIDEPVPDTVLQFLNITLSGGNVLVKDKRYHLTLKYTAQIPGGGDVSGLYRAEYMDGNGVQKWIATSQFETIGFRRMTPSFDEPRFKSVFNISICHDPALKSLSNTVNDTTATDADVMRKDCPAGWKWDHYTPTVKMSTYLLAIVVSEFNCEPANETIFGKPVGICGPKHLIDEPANGGVYAANQSAYLLKAFQDIFGAGLEYPMPKMDSVAIPRDYFQFGAMENWGLNTYRDNLLLYYSGESQESNRYQIASILSHELAHQWFGNLVTANYWSHIWLNEGFATYMSYRGVAETMPEYDAREQFLYDAVQTAMMFDAGPNSHPIINTATPQQVKDMSIFDDISYDKGGSLIRMMEGFMGEETLFNGLRKYLNAAKYQPAVQDDLFKHVGEAATDKLPVNVTLKDIMDTWTLQSGYPLVRVSAGTGGKVYISQERFRNNGYVSKDDSETSDIDPNDLWEIPIAVATEGKPLFTNHTPAFWLQKKVALRSYEHNTNEWIIVNPEGYGYYRVLYDSELTGLIQQQLEKDPHVISPLSKSQLVDDYFNLFAQGYIQVETALAMTKFLAKESSHIVWRPVLSAFSKFQNLFSHHSNPAAYAALKAYFAPKVEGALDLIGWKQNDGEHGINVTLRVSLLDYACAMGSTKCIDTARTYFDEWKTQNTRIPLDIQPVVYCAAIANDDNNFQFVIDAIEKQKTLPVNDSSTAQITRLLSALTCTKDTERALWLLRNSIEPDFINIKYASTIVQGLAKNPNYRVHAVGFIRDNWQYLYKATGSHLIIANVLSAASTYQSSGEDIANHLAFELDVVLKSIEVFNELTSTFLVIRRNIGANIPWVAANVPPSQKWFESNKN